MRRSGSVQGAIHLPLAAGHGDVDEAAGVGNPLLGAALGSLLLLLRLDLLYHMLAIRHPSNCQSFASSYAQIPSISEVFLYSLRGWYPSCHGNVVDAKIYVPLVFLLLVSE